MLEVTNPFLDVAKTYSGDKLMECFDCLDAIPDHFMLGEWLGRILPTGHADEKVLQGFDWAGKRFHSLDNVDPMICLNEDGGRVVNPALGGASLRQMDFRGRCTATMVYDKLPISDHFVKIDDDCVLGVMNRKGKSSYLFFLLTRL